MLSSPASPSEDNGTFSAWVAGLPRVYAAADTAAVAKRAIRSALAAHLSALNALGRDLRPQADVVVLRHDTSARTRRERLRFVGLGALMGKKTTSALIFDLHRDTPHPSRIDLPTYPDAVGAGRANPAR